MEARLYIGEVAHQWGNGKRVRFPAPGLYFPLEGLERLDRHLALFSVGGRTPLSLSRADFESLASGSHQYALFSPRYFGFCHFPFQCAFGEQMTTVFRQPGGQVQRREWKQIEGPAPGSLATYQSGEMGATCRVGVFPQLLDLTMEIPGQFTAWWRGYGRPLNDRELAAMMVRFPLNLWLGGLRRKLIARRRRLGLLDPPSL